jgi:hypothetical protein
MMEKRRGSSPAGQIKLCQNGKLKKGTGMFCPNHSARADLAQTRPPNQNRISTLSYATLSQVNVKLCGLGARGRKHDCVSEQGVIFRIISFHNKWGSLFR